MADVKTITSDNELEIGSIREYLLKKTKTINNLLNINILVRN